MRYWLLKSEPFKYGWDDLIAEKEGTWDGVRNHRAKNNLAAMEVGDQAFFYHSREGLEIVGICEVSVAGITDPTDPEAENQAAASGHAQADQGRTQAGGLRTGPALAPVGGRNQARRMVGDLRDGGDLAARDANRRAGC